MNDYCSVGVAYHFDAMNLIARPLGEGTGNYATACVTRNQEIFF